MNRFIVVMMLIMATVVLVLWTTRPASLPLEALPRHELDPANGLSLFNAGGCASCHTSESGDSDQRLLGGGLAMETPFGLFRVPNISPHPSSGIGDWSMLDFVNAMHLGVSPDLRHYYPAFPYTSYTRMSIEDLMDLKSYLDTLPQVEEVSADHSLKFPWNIRTGIGLWKRFNLDPSFITPVNADDKLLERGRYLVEGPGHCGECHTPRNWMGGLDKTRWLAGAPNPEGEGRVPNITPHKNGLSGWDESDIEYYLASGFTPDFDTVGGSMVKVQENMARLNSKDRAAIAAYLMSIPPPVTLP
jgi:mono/diheme cytochrome c family protein